jgi:predicted alpha/beta-hydrolase family hydrolase
MVRWMISEMTATRIRQIQFNVNDKAGQVSALLARPRGARWLYVMAHGAGAGMRHPFLEGIADRLSKRRIATFRYQFPYMEAGRKRPDSARLLEQTVGAAVAAAATAAPRLPMFAGGKSLGGRVASQAMAAGDLLNVHGLAFLGFPLHAPGRPANRRGEHLKQVPVPMLFLQGDRDRLADLELIRPLCKSLRRRATLHVVDGGDHSFNMLKRSGRAQPDVLDEIADAIAAWAGKVL